MRKTILIIATLVLTLGGSIAVFAETDEPAETTGVDEAFGGVIRDVLGDLVAEGTITEDQAQAIVEALQAKREEARAERRALRDLIEEFWSDGKLTADEVEQLPDWHPWARLTGALEDGVITEDELGGFHRPLRRLRQGR